MSVKRQTELMENMLTNNRVKITQRDSYLFKSAEFETAQTATEMIAAPGAGKRIVIKAVSVATDGSTGEVLSNGTAGSASIIICKLYVTKANSLSQGSINVPLDENTAVTLTTTTGTDKVFVKCNYIVEDV